MKAARKLGFSRAESALTEKPSPVEPGSTPAPVQQGRVPIAGPAGN